MAMRRVWFALVLCVLVSTTARAEVLVRWDQDQLPPPESLGVSSIVLPASNAALVKTAIALGYRVYLEVEAKPAAASSPNGAVSGLVVKGSPSAARIAQIRLQYGVPRGRVVAVNEFGKWPHIRTNWVTKNKDVLQVTGRSAQPWIENNAALVRILRAANPSAAPFLTYRWQPITLSDVDEGPSLDDYLVAIAEAGSFGADLILPLHERFARRLVLGEPDARRDWTEIRRYIEFYSWDLPGRYRPLAAIGVVAPEPMQHFEALNLLARHNQGFHIIAPSAVTASALDGLRLVIVFDPIPASASTVVDEFARKGGLVHRVSKPVTDPNAFALEMRRLVGSGHRIIDIWNGITVLAAPFRSPDGTAMMVSVLNYAHEDQPVQLRVPGTYAVIQYESPETPATLIAPRHRDGFTEFVLPAVRVGGRTFLSQQESRTP
jgi:hypothetical protein